MSTELFTHDDVKFIESIKEYDDDLVVPSQSVKSKEDEEKETDSYVTERLKEILELNDDIVEKIRALVTMNQHPSLVIDYDYFLNFPEVLEKYFLLNSDGFVKNIELLGAAALEIFKEYNPGEILEFETRLRIGDPQLLRPLKSIDTKDINRVVISTGIINSASKPAATYKIPTAVCSNCNYEKQRSAGAKRCPNCGEQGTFKTKLSRTKKTLFQILEVQENDLSSAVPVTYKLKVFGPDLAAGQFKPGDKIKFSSVIKLEKLGQSKTLDLDDEEISQEVLFDLVLEALFIEKYDKVDDQEDEKLTDKDIEQIRKLRADNTDKNLMELLVSKFASHIYGHDIVKKILLIQAVSEMLHVFMPGSPGTSKTELAEFCVAIAEKGMYSAGVGSSGVGLTASTVPDKDGVYSLKSGPVVLCNGGIAAIDELDKMKNEDKSYFLEAMEKGRVTVSKAGINAVLNARTSIVACANPRDGHYDPYKSLIENISVPSPILTRFDAIIIFKDKANEEVDEKIAEKVLGRDSKQREKEKEEIKFLRKYIKYIRANFKTSQYSLSKSLIDTGKRYYVKIRQSVADGATTAITPRQLDGVSKFAIGNAAIMQRDKVTEKDMEEAIDLVNFVLQQIGVDPVTGKVDVGILYRKPIKELSDKDMFREVFYAVTKNGMEAVSRDGLIEALMKDGGRPRAKAENLFLKAYQEGLLLERKAGWFVPA
jgi:replicative DNA helicase Mcm